MIRTTVGGGITPKFERSIHQREINNAIALTMQKNDCANDACVAETHVGSSSRTVSPPSRPCRTTAQSATNPRTRTHLLSSLLSIQSVRITVRNPTPDAIIRCPCSYKIPPTMGGISFPYERGQSGTARPEPVLVTIPPAARSMTVLKATTIE